MKRKLLNILFFFAVMGLTVYVIYRNHDIGKVFSAICSANKMWLIPAVILAVLFVVCESIMIHDLLHMQGHKVSLRKCISYSFIGYFYSGITPSASGGQPMQLYYMRKDGNGLSDSSVVLLTVAFYSRTVLSVIGIFLLIFFHGMLVSFFQGVFFIYWLGLILNTLIASAILSVMVWPGLVRRIVSVIEKLLVRIHVFKHSQMRLDKIESVMEGYRTAVVFMRQHKGKAVYLFFFTLFQRFTLYILTWFVYKSFALSGDNFLNVVLLQAAIYVAVEMLPLPGSQGITELMYHNIFGTIFGSMLTPSMLVVRGLDFYLLMIIGLIYVLVRMFEVKKGGSRPQNSSGCQQA